MARTARAGLEPAPGELRILQALANTAAVGGESEHLTDPQALARLLTDEKLLDRGVELTADDLQRVIAFRDGLRDLFLVNSGAAFSGRVRDRLNELVQGVPMRLSFVDQGAIRVEPSSEGFDEVVGRLLGIVAQAQVDGVWRRLKVCVDSECRRTFYDRSKGVTTVWCMKRCTNRHHARKRRRRQGVSTQPDRQRPSGAAPSKPRRIR